MTWPDLKLERLAMLLVIAMIGTGLSGMAAGAVYLLILLAHPL
jgi:hypothetical protein